MFNTQSFVIWLIVIIFFYSKVSNKRGGWISRVGWKKYQKLIVGGREVGIVGGSEKTANFNSGVLRGLVPSKWAIFIRGLMFWSSPRANFSSFKSTFVFRFY